MVASLVVFIGAIIFPVVLALFIRRRCHNSDLRVKLVSTGLFATSAGSIGALAGAAVALTLYQSPSWWIRLMSTLSILIVVGGSFWPKGRSRSAPLK